MNEKEQILEIREEAKAYGLLWEVEKWAKKYFVDGSAKTRLEAYQMGFNEWIK
jgi:hypothetical protein